VLSCLKRRANIFMVILENCELQDRHVIQIMGMLTCNTVHTLSFKGNKIGTDGALAIIKWICNYALESAIISINLDGNPGIPQYVIDFINNQIQLVVLLKSRNCSSDEGKMLLGLFKELSTKVKQGLQLI